MSAVLDMLSSLLRRVLTRALHSYLSQYIKDISLEGLGLMGSDLVLENLELRLDVLQVKSHNQQPNPTNHQLTPSPLPSHRS